MYFDCQYVGPTSWLLAWFRMNLNPGMRFELHTTPTSSECLQSDTPKPLDSQWARLFSLPVQCTLSSQIRPGTNRNRNTLMDVCSDVDSLCPRWLFLDGRDDGAFEGILFIFYKKQVFSLSQANIISWQADVKIFNRSEHRERCLAVFRNGVIT